MPLNQIDPIFYGKADPDVRKRLKSMIDSSGKTVERVVIPCAGTFSLEEVLVESGYKPGQIHSNDISLYSSILGFVFDPDKNLDGLGFCVTDPEIEKFYTGWTSEINRAARMLYVMKLVQMSPLPGKGQSDFNRWKRLEFIHQSESIIAKFEASITAMNDRLYGLKYTVGDAFPLIQDMAYDQGAFIYFDPPFYKKDYDKMFDPKGYYTWAAPAIDGLGPDQYDDFMLKVSKGSALIMVYLSNWASFKSLPPGYRVLFSKQVDRAQGKRLYVLGNHPMKKPISIYSIPQEWPKKIYAVYRDQEITQDSTLDVVPISRELAMYYYDLFVRELGMTGAECYYAITIDGRVFAVAGFLVHFWLRSRTPQIFENFGTTVISHKYPRLAKLTNMAVTCRKFTDLVESEYDDQFRCKIGVVRTACLCTYPENTAQRGIFILKERKKLKNGRYHLVYETKVFERDYKGVLTAWLKKYSKKTK